MAPPRIHQLPRDRCRELLDAFVVNFGDVDVPARIDAEHVRHPELSRRNALLAKAAEGLPVGAEDADPVRTAVGHEQSIPGQEPPVRSAALLPLVEELSLRVEDLHAVVLSIADVDAALRVHADRVRQVELARACALRAPLL